MIPPGPKAQIVIAILAAKGEFALIDEIVASNIYNGVIDNHHEGPAACASNFVGKGDLYREITS